MIALAGLCAGAVLHATALAQAVRPGDELDLLAQENLVYSAARYVQTIAETPANVTIIGRADIARYGYRSVSDALRSLPGVYDAASQWPALGVSGLAVSGDFGSRVLYLVNGMPVYEPTYGGFFLDYLDIESIERIEFVKGAGSALYGSGAVLGLVNLITHGAGAGSGSAAGVTLGSHASGKAYLSNTRDSEGVSSFVAASVQRSRGRDLYLPEMDSAVYGGAGHHGHSAGNDRSRSARLFARVSRNAAWLQALLVTGTRRDPLASYGTVFGGRLTLRESMSALEAGLTREAGEGGQLTARVYSFATTERGDYPYAFSRERGVAADYINVSDLYSRQAGAEVRYDRFFASGHHVLIGVEAKHIGYTHKVGDQPGLERGGVFSVDRRDSYRQWALFAQDEIRLGPGILTLGARLDSYHGFSDGVTSRASPRMAYVQDIAPGVTAKVIYGEAYRAPTIYESRYQDGLPAASTIWANDNLRPELSRSFEALLMGHASDGVEWRVSTFFKHLQDTPVQVSTPELDGRACGLGVNACIQYRNSSSHQSVIGTEIDLRWRHDDAGDAYASLVLQRGRGEGGDMASSPRRQFKAGVSRASPWPGVEGALEAQYIGSVRGFVSGQAGNSAIGSYVLLNAVLNARRFADGWQASLRIDNLLDRDYATVASRELHPLRSVPADGRRFSLQLLREF